MTDVRSLTARTVALDTADLMSEMRSGGIVWIHGADGFVAWGEAARIEVGTGAQRFERAAAAVQELFERISVEDEVKEPGSGPVAFASFTFDEGLGGSILVVPAVVLAVRGGRTWRTIVGPGDKRAATPVAPPSDRVRYAGSSTAEIAWLEAVASAERSIRMGRLDKVVLARDVKVWSKHDFDERVLARRLARAFPECFTFALGNLVGATPELLARRSDRSIESMVLAGSARRGADADEDARLGALLLASDKDRREHALAVASVRATLEQLCDALDVQPEMKLLRLANVQHLSTTMRGSLSADISALQVAGRLHPTAAVCGAPTDAAMDLIRSLEDMDRGRYGGPIGWVDARGDGEWGIALRCAELAGSRARLFAGAGIVSGSIPEAELEETRLKLRAMQSAFSSPNAPEPGLSARAP